MIIENLPALITDAEARLAKATTSEEVIDIMQLAKSAQHHAKLTKATNEAHADCLRLVIFSQMFLAAEVDTAQANGEIATAGGDRQSAKSIVSNSNNGPATISELGFNRFQLHEWRKKLAVGKPYIESIIQEALAADRAPTDAEIRRAVARMLQDERKGTLPIVAPAVGKYGTIVIDPPWPIGQIDRVERPNQVGPDYPVMTVVDIEALNIIELADEACHLFLWTTQKFLPDALYCLDAWGFAYCLTMVWHKPGGFQPYGLPQYNCEFVVYGRAGGPKFVDTKDFPVCFEAPRREHSRKPDEFYQTIARVTDGARLEMFAREAHEGFEAWGNEPEHFDG